jgi:radical SAM protein with 4Fe4S-binding SPASM domain
MQSVEHAQAEKKGFKFQFMPEDLYKKLLDDLQEFPDKLKKLEFYGMGEPLCNPRLPDMLKLAKASDVARKLTVMTNGALLTHELSRALIESGVDEIRISLQGLSAEQYWKTSKAKIDFDKFLDEIAYLYSIRNNCKLFVKIIGSALTEEDQKENKLHKLFAHITDAYSVEGLLPLFQDLDYDKIGVLAPSRFGEVIPKRFICHFQFYRVIVLSDGRVSSCCDPLNGFYWGNIGEQSLKSIWDSKPRIDFLKRLLSLSKLPAMCKKCYLPMDMLSEADNLAPYADEILERLNKLS